MVIDDDNDDDDDDDDYDYLKRFKLMSSNPWVAFSLSLFLYSVEICSGVLALGNVIFRQ